MAIGKKRVMITIDVDTGEVDITHEGAQKYEGDTVKAEIEGIRRENKDHKRIAEILLTPTEQGCLYWDGNRWVKYC